MFTFSPAKSVAMQAGTSRSRASSVRSLTAWGSMRCLEKSTAMPAHWNVSASPRAGSSFQRPSSVVAARASR
jgi:hypothetical protein